ncbi:TetR family transcriptional regulator C-terminal domain-containing protein [Umezawaea sp. Da 62-37]|uniref:TetR/AcrR family transcriptional regulator n=1 Tax=Umezawaea sp. Da 62-37 TaxID=3075927 RepID=UPI0028F70D0A|nr:TetR family transcriptional regulator C-terminal domain-containing protein [Umezawaea sp. Da 62-37]WNV89552.1 TetR family transcriptional regulator C-terminal domain-containing protein [Umezawaea sp. Da 62-37]
MDPEARRSAVVDALFRVVRREGVEQASLRNVAEEAGLAIGSVRHYFDSHDELLVFALRELEDRVEVRIRAGAERILAAESSAERRPLVEALLGELLPLDADRRDEAVIWLAFVTAARTRPSLRPSALRLHEGLRMIVGRILARAAEFGALPDGMVVDVETERLAALIDGLAVNAVLQPDRTTPEVMAAVLRRHLDDLAG